MVLGYLKKSVKDYFYFNYRRIMLRRNHLIGKNCVIGKKVYFNGRVQIKNDVKIRENVKLGDGVLVGNKTVLSNIEIGQQSQIEGNVICLGEGGGEIIIGDNSYIGLSNVLDWSGNIYIGDYVHISGPSTALWTHSSVLQALHGRKLNDKDVEFRPLGSIIIEDNVYIGGNCTIYPGVKIKHHTVVAPNSVVNRDVEPFTMVGGVPARFIKKIKL